jgi:hypothetical protein
MSNNVNEQNFSREDIISLSAGSIRVAEEVEWEAEWAGLHREEAA